MFDRIRRRARALLDRGGLEREMDDEIRFHIEMEVDELVRGGMSPEEARRVAMRDFGGVERYKEEVRDARGVRPWEELGRDLRLGFRALRRSAGYSAAVVVTLGVGIGATTALFSVVNGVLLRPLPYPGAERIVQLWQLNDEGEESQFSEPNFLDLRAESRAFSAMAQYSMPGGVSVMTGSEPVRVQASTVSSDFFRVLGASPALGRLFAPEEVRRGGAPAVVVSDAFWRRHLDADPAMTGRALTFNGAVFPVIGVMPPGFAFPAGAEVWTARELSAPQPYRTGHNWRVIGRLREGVPLASARLEATSVARRLKGEYGDDTWMEDVRLTPLQEEIVGPVRGVLLVLLGAAAFLLLIASANAGNLLLTRLSGRRRELAVRLAIGARRWHLVRQMVAETLVLAGLGALLGVAVAALGTRALIAASPEGVPRLEEVAVDWAAVLVALGVAALVALALALGATLGVAGRGELRASLAEGERGAAGGVSSRRVRSGLIVMQVALALVLLVGSALLARSLLRLLAVDPGFATEGVVLLDVDLPWPGEPAQAARQTALYDQLFERLEGTPGVRAVGGVSIFPLGDGGGPSGTYLELDPAQPVPAMEAMVEMMKDPARTGEARYRVASAGYFAAMGIPLLRGRLFDERDGPDAPHVAVVSRALADRRWPGQDPIGKVIEFGNMDGDLRPFTVIGVVGDVREESLAQEPAPVLYAHYRQRVGPASRLNVAIRHTGEAAPVAAAARAALRDLDPTLPPEIRTVEETVSESLARRRFSMTLLAAFGGAALLLAVVGIYGVIAYLVAQRTREIGIRMAFGARVADVLALIVRQGVGLALAGVAIGAAAALLLTRTLVTLLYGISPTDPLTFATVAALLVALAALASWLPARRAARVNPVVALRSE